MNLYNHICGFLGASLVMAATVSCTDLDEVTFDRIDASAYYQNESSVKGAVASIYSNVTSGIFEYFEFLQELPADQVAWRCWNDGWGFDEGEKYVLSTQSWNSEAKIIREAWEHAWETIGLCNLLISDLEGINPESIGMTEASLKSYIAEVRTMRAFCYYNNFELWGGALPLNVSVTTDIPGSASTDFNEGCRLIWDFISEELDGCYADMVVEAGAPGTRLRFNQGANRILKMRLLLNSELWTGVDHYSECAALAQELIDGKYGNYSLVTDYRTIYDVNNSNCPEVIFAFAQEVGKLTNNNRNTPFLPLAYGPIFGTNNEQTGWNCVIITPSHDNSGVLLDDIGHAYGTTGSKSFLYSYGDKLGCVYDRFNDADVRKQAFSCDAAGNWSGNFLKGAQLDYETGQPFLADAELDGFPLIYVDQAGTFDNTGRTLEVVMDPRWTMTNSGYRFLRYPIFPDASGFDWRNASFVEMRISEAFYTLAECKLRSGDTGGAKQLVNEVRQRYYNSSDVAVIEQPGPGFTDFDMDWMLSEWGLEFLSEGRRRRTDLRRFDKFTQGQWWFWGRATAIDRDLPVKRDRKYEWYPLPQTALMVNPGLVQNPNY